MRKFIDVASLNMFEFDIAIVESVQSLMFLSAVKVGDHNQRLLHGKPDRVRVVLVAVEVRGSTVRRRFATAPRT